MKRILISSFFLLLPGSALAAVEITKVEYDLPGPDEGREWVEITNNGSSTADLTGFKFLEGGVKHKLSLAQGSWLLASGEMAIIADDPTTFLSEHQGFTKSIYGSSFSLSNTGETLSLVNAAGAIESSHTYQAATPQKAPSVTKATTKKSSSSSPKQPATVASASFDAFTQTSTSENSAPGLWVWYLGLAVVLGLGVAGVVLAQQNRQKELETKENSFEFEVE